MDPFRRAVIVIYLLCLPLKGHTPFRCHDIRAWAFREQAISKPQHHVTCPSNEQPSLIFYFGLTETRTNKDKQALEGSSLFLDPFDPNVCVNDTNIHQRHGINAVRCQLTAPSRIIILNLLNLECVYISLKPRHILRWDLNSPPHLFFSSLIWIFSITLLILWIGKDNLVKSLPKMHSDFSCCKHLV